MDYSNGILVFETLLKDNFFFSYVNDFIQSKLLKTKSFESKHIPSLLFIISTLLTTDKKYIKLMKNIKTVNDFNDLYYQISDYVVNKINEIIKINELNITFDYKDFIVTYGMCLKLILMYHPYPTK
jgi:hypothetical protein